MFKKIGAFLFIVFIACLCSCSKSDVPGNGSERNSTNQNDMDVSIINLIATPEKYHSKRVRVIGVGHLEFEWNAVYLSRDDYQNDVDRNGLWLVLGERATPYEEAQKFNGKYVIIEGTFDKNYTGHMGLWSGAITNITRYDLRE